MGISGVHTGAGAAGRTYVQLEIIELFLVDLASLEGADCLKHGGKARALAVHMTGKHRTAGNEDRRDVHTRRGHQKTRYVLVAVRDHDERIKRVRQRHRLGGISDQVTGDEGILHASVTHRDTVTDCDRREHDRRSACHGYSLLYGFDDLVDIHMTRYDLIIGADDADQRTLHLLLGQTKCVQQRALRRKMRTGSFCIKKHT